MVNGQCLTTMVTSYQVAINSTPPPLVWMSIKFSLNFIPDCSTKNKPDQPISHYLDQWWLSLMTHICITRPQWVKACRRMGRQFIIFFDIHKIVYNTSRLHCRHNLLIHWNTDPNPASFIDNSIQNHSYTCFDSPSFIYSIYRFCFSCEWK